MLGLRLVIVLIIRMVSIIVLLFTFKGCIFKDSSQIDSKVSSNSKGDNLMIAKHLLSAYSKKSCTEFLAVFPDNFTEFYGLYGWDKINDEPYTLYNNYESHIPFLFECLNFNNEDEIRKLFSICVDGKWEADGIGFFQDRVLKIVESDPKEILEILKTNFNSKEIAAIWYFLFDGPHPEDQANKKIYIKIHESIIEEYPQQTELLEQQYLKLLEQNYHHH